MLEKIQQALVTMNKRIDQHELTLAVLVEKEKQDLQKQAEQHIYKQAYEVVHSNLEVMQQQVDLLRTQVKALQKDKGDE